jgi:hypothetical protein
MSTDSRLHLRETYRQSTTGWNTNERRADQIADRRAAAYAAAGDRNSDHHASTVSPLSCNIVQRGCRSDENGIVGRGRMAMRCVRDRYR